MSTMMRAVQFEAGGPEKMSVGEVLVPELKQQEVLIKVITTAINRADTLQRKGQYPPPPGASSILGLEAAGLIDQVGPGCSDKWKVGDRVMALLNDKGINLILDCVGASFWEQNVAALAVDGRWVLYGLLGGGNINGDLLAKILRKRINITGTTLRARSTEYKAELIRDFTEKALPAFQSGQLHPIIDTEFPLERIADAHRYMEENRNTGKILVTVSTEGKGEL